MGAKILRLAEKLGFLDFPQTVLHAQPRRVGKEVDIGEIVKKYMKEVDRRYRYTKKGHKVEDYPSYSYYYLSEMLQTFIDVQVLMLGVYRFNASGYVVSIRFYTYNEDLIREIAKRVYYIWPDGLFPHLNWESIWNKFDVQRKDVIQKWSKWVDFDSSALATMFVCPNCKRRLPISSIKKTEPNVECPKCGKWVADSMEQLQEIATRDASSLLD